MGSSLCAQRRVGRKLAEAAEGLHNLMQSIALKFYHLEGPLVLHFLVTVPFLSPLHLMKALGCGRSRCLCRYAEAKA